MSPLTINSIYCSDKHDRIWQGDIIADVVLFYAGAADKAGNVPIVRFNATHIVVLTQDCDLQQDQESRQRDGSKDNDKTLNSILVCPAYLAEQLRSGTHLESMGLQMEKHDSKRFSLIRSNQNPRYHYLKAESAIQVPELIIDFKHYYTVSTDYIYSIYHNKYLAALNPLFRENLSHRFSSYLSRIGLPEFGVPGAITPPSSLPP